jgi:hypothetical protein
LDFTNALNSADKLTNLAALRLKREKCLLGLATPRKHSLPTCQKERKRGLSFINRSISNNTPQTINEKEKLAVYRLGTISGKTICHSGLNLALGYTNLTLAPTGSQKGPLKATEHNRYENIAVSVD